MASNAPITTTASNATFTTVIWIAGAPGHPLDSVAAWRAHVAVNRLEPACHAFTYRSGASVLPLRHTILVEAAKQMARRAKLDPRDISGHSFRRGGASYAFQCGVPDILIQRQGDWASMCYREYVAVSADDALVATQHMFAGMELRVSAPETWGAQLMASDDPLGHVGTGGAPARWARG